MSLLMLRLGLVGPLGAGGSSARADLNPILVATALLCVVGLARREHVTSAWLATIAAGFVVTIDLAVYARSARALVDDDGWRNLAIVVSLSALVAIGASIAYATSRPRLRRRWLSLEGGAVLLVLGAVAGWAVANPSDTTLVAGSPLGSLGVVTRSFIAVTAAATLVGVLGDLLPAAERASRRVGVTFTGSASTRDRVPEWVRAFIDEVSPGRRRARRAVLAERSRVARDIHAEVVPALRQALIDAEHGVPAERLAASLRDVLVELEAVGTAAHPIQLEIGGLVAALEWLAERVERRSDLSVNMDVEGTPAVAAGQPPAEVAAAAFRVAALALDNVVRHASAAEASISVGASTGRVELSVCDDGVGIDEEAFAIARAAGRRGMLDMAHEADACGAVVTVNAAPSGTGTCVTFEWSTGGRGA